MYFSQDKEDSIIDEYLRNTYGVFTGTILEIGANDGSTFSNSKHFILKGWGADLVEPAAIPFKRLKALHRDRPKVKLHDFAISTTDDYVPFYENLNIIGKDDSGLLSTLVPHHKKVCETEFKISYLEYNVETCTFESFLSKSLYKKWDIVSIDTEGNQVEVLKQIDLKAIECKCLCIEHAIADIMTIINHVKAFDMELYQVTKHNLIFVKTNKNEPGTCEKTGALQEVS